MDRKKKLVLNTFSSLFYQLITIVSGFILPRFFLDYYGSEVNGLVSSITQFLAFISLAECGVGAVVRSTLYKPLAENDEVEISKIFISSERFFQKIAKILIIYTLFVMIIYPLLTLDSFNYLFTLSLIFVISLTSFMQYYFSISYSLLLDADAYGFIQVLIRSITLIFNVFISIYLMINNYSIHFVKLMSALIFVIQPVFLRLFVKYKYNLDKNIELKEEPIKQKWNGFIQHISAVVLGNTDIAVLTIFSTLKNVSVYSIYFLVVNGVKQIINSLTGGIQPLFGNMYANNEIDSLNNTFSFVEWILHTLTIFAFTCTGILIIDFIKIYTKGISDANYINYSFAFFMCAAQAAYCIRLSYNMMVLAAGHYRQTQMSCIVEVIINLSISIVLVIKYGLVGVAIGTFVAMLYRTCYLAYYLSKNILNRNIKIYIKHIVVDLCTVITIYFSTYYIEIFPTNYILWIYKACIVSIISLIVIFIINYVFYRDYIKSFMNKFILKKRG